jgi:hypothetical protein
VAEEGYTPWFIDSNPEQNIIEVRADMNNHDLVPTVYKISKGGEASL